MSIRGVGAEDVRCHPRGWVICTPVFCSRGLQHRNLLSLHRWHFPTEVSVRLQSRQQYFLFHCGCVRCVTYVTTGKKQFLLSIDSNRSQIGSVIWAKVSGHLVSWRNSSSESLKVIMKTYIEIQLCKQEVSVHTIRQTEETARRTHQKKEFLIHKLLFAQVQPGGCGPNRLGNQT